MSRRKKYKAKPYRNLYGGLYGGYSYDFGAKERSESADGDDDSDGDAIATGEYGAYRPYYYYEPPVSAAYVEQMASAFSGAYQITIERGETWAINLKTKTLTYNPERLRRSSQAEVIAALLHEIGHLRHTTDYDDIRSEWLTKYPKGARKVLNLFEDFRVDEIMAKSYSGAEDIYALNREAVYAEAQKHFDHAEAMRKTIMRKTIIGKIETTIENPDDSAKAEMREKIQRLQQTPLLQEYCGEICYRGYGLPPLTFSDKQKLLTEYVERTFATVASVKRLPSTQAIADILGREVYPIIEPLLKEYEQNAESDADMAIQVRLVAAADDSDIPPRKSYAEMAALMLTHTQELTRRLRAIRRNEEVVKFQSRMRSGRVHLKRLYRAALDDPRLFRRRLRVDTRTTSIAFSLLVDVSGSMQGERAIAALKSTVVLLETAKRLDIPAEVIAFNQNAHTLKNPNQILTITAENKLAGVIGWHGEGNTRTAKAIHHSGIQKSGKPYRFMCIITDGEDNGQIIRAALDTLCGVIPFQIAVGDGKIYLPREYATGISDVKELPQALAEAVIKAVRGELKPWGAHGKTR